MRKTINIICLIIFLYSLFMIYTIAADRYRSRELNNSVENVYLEAQEFSGDPFDIQYKFFLKQRQAKSNLTEKPKLPKFNALLDINPDTVGWIRIDNTIINYPVVKANDNEFYLNHNFKKEKSYAGSIFMDCQNSIFPIQFNTIIYGHNMKGGSMFNNLNKFKSEEFLLENNIIYLDTLYEETKWQVFSAYITDQDFNYRANYFKSEEAYESFLSSIKQKSLYMTDVQLTRDDKILTLSTCTYEFDNARFVVHAKLIKN